MHRAHDVFMHACMDLIQTKRPNMTESTRVWWEGGKGEKADGHLASTGVDKKYDLAIGLVRTSQVCVRVCMRARAQRGRERKEGRVRRAGAFSHPLTPPPHAHTRLLR